MRCTAKKEKKWYLGEGFIDYCKREAPECGTEMENKGEVVIESSENGDLHSTLYQCPQCKTIVLSS